MSNPIYQEKAINFVKHYLSAGLMIPVYGHTSAFDTEAFFQCQMIPIDAVDKELENDDTNGWQTLTPGFTEYGSGENAEVVYLRFGDDSGAEPLIIKRDFDGLGVDDEIEISEEFRLLNNLYYYRTRNEYVDLENDTVVIKVENGYVTVHKGYLIRFLAVKEMAMIVHLDSRYFLDSIDKSIKIGSAEILLDKGIATFTSAVQGRRNFSMLYAKLAILGCHLSDCGYWPFTEWKKEYENFIIGVDNMGNERLFTCNPNCLDNYFGKNPDAPLYLTPVFFKREVLQKYYDAPKRYSIEDGVLRCGSQWLISIDNQSSEYVSAYLGDLGRDLPSQREQKHWRQFNIAIDGELSKAKRGRDFFSLFIDPDSPVFQFQHKYKSLNKEFTNRLGWELFLPLNEDDVYNFSGLRIPLSNSQPEFDSQVLSLVKVMIDSLNEKKITSFYVDPDNEFKGSITKLNKMLDTIGIQGADIHISFLRALQELRSTGTGHRKGKSYEKASRVFGLPDCGFRPAFEGILRQAVGFLDFMQSNVDAITAYQSSHSTAGGPA